MRDYALSLNVLMEDQLITIRIEDTMPQSDASFLDHPVSSKEPDAMHAHGTTTLAESSDMVDLNEPNSQLCNTTTTGGSPISEISTTTPFSTKNTRAKEKFTRRIRNSMGEQPSINQRTGNIPQHRRKYPQHQRSP